ncbi:MAG TPA: hypothetical protein VG754_01045 [Verrucomicrobiae bacterium]|nr:hypothetical protein [Verrucomicrobiae bacterium]
MSAQNLHQLPGRITGLLFVLLAAGFVAGCTSAKTVAKSEGQGARRTFHVSYETAWMASRGAIADNDLRVIDLDRRKGSILAKRDIGMTTFGENVGVWVRRVAPELTSIEVVSRHVGPPVLPGQGLEKPILDNIATMLDE